MHEITKIKFIKIKTKQFDFEEEKEVGIKFIFD
jgi:hypothetical protein